MVISFQTGVIALLSALLVWNASYNKGYILNKGFISNIFIWIGSRSYALYLTHLFSYLMTREIFFRIYHGQTFNDKFLPGFLLVGITMSFALAEINYRLLEMPLRKKGMIKAKKITSEIILTLDEERKPVLQDLIPQNSSIHS